MMNETVVPNLEHIPYSIEELYQEANELGYDDFYHKDFIIPHSPNARSLWASALNEQHVVTASGNRGSGKTSLMWSYIFELCLSIEKFTVVIAREEYSTVNDTLLTSLAKHILAEDLRSKSQPFIFKERPSRFYFPSTGARIIFMGLRFPDQLRGLEPILVVLEEASKIKKPEVLGIAIGSMFGGRGAGEWYVNGRPFYQILLLTNPDRKDNWVYEHHWSKDGAINEELLPPDIDPEDLSYNKLWLWFDLQDNPINSDDGINDNATGKRNRGQLLAGLANQSEHLYRRDGLGEWVSAEGQVYKITEKNVLTKEQIKEKWGLEYDDLLQHEDWNLYRSMDWGNIKPNICTWVAHNTKTDDRLVYREWRRTHADDEMTALAVIEESKNETIRASTIDHDEQKQKMLRRHGVQTVFARKGNVDGVSSLTAGITLVNGALRRAQEDKPGGLYILEEKDLLCFRDHHSDARKWPKSLIAEMNGLEYKPDKDVPEDDGDDACDTVRYHFLYFNAKNQVPIIGKKIKGRKRPARWSQGI